MSVSDVAEALEAFVRLEGEVASSDASFSRSVDLFENGYVDSAGVVMLIDWLERTYGIALEEHELFDERFSTIDGIAEIVQQRLERRD